MNTSQYYFETVARQRMDDTVRQARTTHQRRQIKARTGWHFPKVSFPARPHLATARPA